MRIFVFFFLSDVLIYLSLRSSQLSNAINDFVSYMESTGKITEKEANHLIKSMESPLEKTHKHLPQLLTRKEVADMLKVCPKGLQVYQI